MEFRNTLGAILADNEELTFLLQRLEKADELSALELDLVLQKLRNIYDLVLDIQRSVGDANVHVPQRSGAGPSSSNEPVMEIIKDDAEEEEKKRQAPVETKVKQTETSKEEWKEATRQQITKELKEQEPPHKEPEHKRTYVSDRFKTANPTLNEELAGKGKSDDLSSKLKSKPIGSITGALGLNEKFELIKELFDGNKEKFEKTMQILNMAGSFVEAYNYLEENFDWDMDSPYVQRLLELIRRKLIVRRDDQ